MSLTLQIDTPILEVSEFCRRTGAEESAVKRQLQERNIPSISFSKKKGAKMYVDMVAIYRMAAEAEELVSMSNLCRSSSELRAS